MKRNQNTLATSCSCEGVGLFSGEPVHVTLKPAEADQGIRFVRTDMEGSPVIPAQGRYMRTFQHRSGLQLGQARVETTEHLMSALAGMQVDNCIVELDAPELPAMDGSALPFVEMIRSAGLRELDVEKKQLVVVENITFTQGELALIALPGEDDVLTISYTLDYADPLIGFQSYIVKCTPDRFAREIAPARTFNLRSEAEAMQAAGLVKGGTTQNNLIVDQDGIVDNELRFPDEFVRHKIADLIGDLAMSGLDIRGRLIAHKTGHASNARFVVKLLEAYDRSSVVTKERHLDVQDIKKILRHRYPMLLLDKVLEIHGEERAVGLKNVTINEEFFQGHFEDNPVMPGVLQLDALAQLAGMLFLRKLQHTGKSTIILSINKAKFRRAVRPGDQLIMEVDTIRRSGQRAHVRARSSVEGQTACEAEMKFMLVDI